MGLKYEVQDAGPRREELWNQKTVRVFAGGFDINPEHFPRSVTYALKGLPMNVNHTSRQARPVKTAVVAAALGAEGVEITVKKNHLFIVGDIIGDGAKAAAITAIDTSGATTDVITIGAAIGAKAIGAVLAISEEAGNNKPIRKANALNYADVKLDGQPSVSAIYAADEVRRGRLPYALTDAIESDLTARFLFIP